MNYKLVNTDNILNSIEENIYNDIFTIIKSKSIVKVQQYPYSNILLVPEESSEKIIELIAAYSLDYLAIMEKDINLALTV